MRPIGASLALVNGVPCIPGVSLFRHEQVVTFLHGRSLAGHVDDAFVEGRPGCLQSALAHVLEGLE
jgi:hypothetical protein